MDVNVPQAFLCHASEDKDLLVKPFGVHLASLGVRPWVDEWEMFAGDGLVGKLETGLKESELSLQRRRRDLLSSHRFAKKSPDDLDVAVDRSRRKSKFLSFD